MDFWLALTDVELFRVHRGVARDALLLRPGSTSTASISAATACTGAASASTPGQYPEAEMGREQQGLDADGLRGRDDVAAPVVWIRVQAGDHDVVAEPLGIQGVDEQAVLVSGRDGIAAGVQLEPARRALPGFRVPPHVDALAAGGVPAHALAAPGEMSEKVAEEFGQGHVPRAAQLVTAEPRPKLGASPSRPHPADLLAVDQYQAIGVAKRVEGFTDTGFEHLDPVFGADFGRGVPWHDGLPVAIEESWRARFEPSVAAGAKVAQPDCY